MKKLTILGDIMVEPPFMRQVEGEERKALERDVATVCTRVTGQSAPMLPPQKEYDLP